MKMLLLSRTTGFVSSGSLSAYIHVTGRKARETEVDATGDAQAIDIVTNGNEVSCP